MFGHFGDIYDNNGARLGCSYVHGKAKAGSAKLAPVAIFEVRINVPAAEPQTFPVPKVAEIQLRP